MALALVFTAITIYDMRTPAYAQFCTVTAGNLDFGTVDLSSGLPVNTNATFNVFCIGTPSATVRICPNFNSGIGGTSPGGDPRQMLSGINQLNYNIYKNTGYSQVWGSHIWGWPPTPPTIDLPLSGGWFLGFGSTTFIMRGRIAGGQSSAPSGLYTSSFAGAQTRVSYRYTSSGNCPAITAVTGVQTPFTVSANVLTTCTVGATNLDFGTSGLLTLNVDASASIIVNCNSGIPYSISLDGGLSGAPGPTLRQMASGANNITYGIYQNAARTTPWGDTLGTDTVSSVGTGLNQTFTTFGRVPPQATPPPATYQDTIVVTVTY
ncbi:MAG: spore coat U domain-containing protein [Rhizobiaceae bacterium]|nr:spore coat U domain-containing protein [Rhizobiaceae bacterium]